MTTQLSSKTLPADTYVIDRGQGETILFLHGVPDTADMWLPFIETLSATYRTIAADLPGLGRSGISTDFDFSLDAMAGWVDQVLTSRGITGKVTLVVHDFGGHYGLAWAVKNPERVAGLVISNTNFFSDYRWHIGAKLWRTPILGDVAMKLMKPSAYVDAVHKYAPNLSKEQIYKVYEMGLSKPIQKQTMLKLYRVSDSSRFKGWEDKLTALTNRVPTLVLWGDADPFASPTVADRFGGQVVHYAQYSHWLPIEGGAEVVEAVRMFMAESVLASQ